MDESVAFSKVCPSDKENLEVPKISALNKSDYIMAIKSKKGVKTNRNETYSKRSILNYGTNPRKSMGVKKMTYYDQRRGSYLK